MMKKVIAFIMVLAMVLSISSVAFAADVNITGSTIKETISGLKETTETSITFKMADGEYAFSNYDLSEQITGNYLHYGWGTKTGHVDENYPGTWEKDIYKLSVDLLEFTGSENARITNMTFTGDAGTFFYPHNSYGGIVYVQSFDIGTLKFSGITFESELTIGPNDKCEIDNLVFENVTFSKGNDAPSNGSAVRIEINENIKSITFKNCTFKDCDTVESGCIVTNCTSADDVDITIDGCTFESSGYNAIQIAGAGPYKGDISITNNKISNTKDRGIRISKTTDEANISIEGNTLVNATDEDKEAIKIDGAAEVTVKNNTLDGNPIPQSAVIAKDASSLSVTFDTPAPAPAPQQPSAIDKFENKVDNQTEQYINSISISGGSVKFTLSGNGATVLADGVVVYPDANGVYTVANNAKVTITYGSFGVEIPKTGDMPFWAAVAAFFGF